MAGDISATAASRKLITENCKLTTKVYLHILSIIVEFFVLKEFQTSLLSSIGQSI
jgi:hypothetical protein